MASQCVAEDSHGQSTSSKQWHDLNTMLASSSESLIHFMATANDRELPVCHVCCCVAGLPNL